MTVDGPDDRPLALRELAHAESPEIVRAALGRFRRRLLARGVVVVLIVAVGAFLYPRYFRDIGDLRSEIAKGRGVALNNVIRKTNVEATILRVARLRGEVLALDEHVERFGINLIVTNVPSGPPGLAESYKPIVSLLQGDPDHNGVLFYQVESNAGLINGIEMWIDLKAGTSTVDIPIAVVASNGAGAKVTAPTVNTVHIDMTKLGVPDWTWR